MKTYKSLEHFKSRLEKNTGQKVNCWDDDGIKLNGKTFNMVEYGNLGFNWTGNCYVKFQNKNDFVTVEYRLLPEHSGSKTNNIFEFVDVYGTVV